MSEIWYTAYHGDTWEEMCNVLLSLKHSVSYQPISDKGGDMGLDGLVLSEGIVYQAYGQEPGNKNPKQGVMDKINKDLKKLKENSLKIAVILAEAKICKWVLLLNGAIPSSSIHEYIKVKEKEVKSWNLPFISDDFQVLIQPPSYFTTEHLEYKKRRDDRIEINVPVKYAPSMDGLHRNPQFLTVLEKFKKIVDESVAEKLAYNQFKEYFENSEQLSEVSKQEPDFYNEIEAIRIDVENAAEMDSLIAGSYESMSQTQNTLESRLNNKIGDRLGAHTLNRVRKYIIADWFIRCPLDFKKQG